MEKAVIYYRGQVLEAWEHEDRWTVQLGELEASSRYLDFALAALVEDGVGRFGWRKQALPAGHDDVDALFL